MDQASARQSGSENVLARNSALTADFLPADFIAKEMVKEMGAIICMSHDHCFVSWRSDSCLKRFNEC